MRIAKRSKKALSPYPKVNALILAIQDAADDELPAILNSVQYWHWPRTDLHYWIKPLSRFDNILEEVCKSYNIGNGDNVQVNVFTPRTKELVLAILRYTRLLLENATNRKLYASFDRMNDLLLTRDLDVLESVLRLIFRRAQQIASNGQMHQAGTFNLTPDRVRDLTKGWKAVQQSSAGLTMFDLVKNDYSSVVINPDLEEVSFQFYRKAASPGSLAKELPESSGEGIAMTPLATPAPKSSTSRSSRPTTSTAMNNPPMTPSGGKTAQSAETEAEGMTSINLGNVAESGKSATDLLADAMELYRVPQEEKIHLLQRIRVAMAIKDVEKRRQMLRIRLLAICVLVHTTDDAMAESTIFLYEPTFIAQVSDLVHPNNQVPMDVRTAALLCLDTVSRVRNKVGEVTTSLSVNVNHGTLMSILRRLVSDLQSEHPETSTEYIDALFNFLMHLQTTGFAGNMLLGAGIIPILIDLVKEPTSNNDALLAANRAVSFLDNFTYSFGSAATPFASAGGLQIFVERVSQLVKRGVGLSHDRTSNTGMDIAGGDQETLSYPETTLLKSLFRCLQRLMGSGGNAEGVRNLIDSSLVESCRLVMQNRKVFGPQNLALAINIMLTFVHNEPTSLTVLQEGKIPDAFYDAIEGEIEPSLDVLSAIPTAIGALCLNEAGLTQFINTRLSIITKFFDIFQNEKHARVLNERENAVVIGANFDELVRHHPDLKQPVFEAITALLKSLHDKGKDYVPENPDGYRLVQVTPVASTSDSNSRVQTLAEAQASEVTNVGGDISMSESDPAAANMPTQEQQDDAAEAKKEDNQMLTSIAITGRFLEGFFSTPSHCKDYIKKDGLDPLLRLFTLPCIPFDLNSHSPYPGLTTVFLTMNENSPGPLLKALLSHTKAALLDIREFWKTEDVSEAPLDAEKLQTKMEEMLHPQTAEALDNANNMFRAIVKAQLIIAILSELHSLDSYVSRQPSTQLLSTLKSSEEIKAIHDLCALQRACVLANVRLKASMPNAAKASSPTTLSAISPTTPSVETITTQTTAEPVAMEGTAAEPEREKEAQWSESKLKNAKALKTVLASIPESLKLFLQGVMTVQMSRRSQVDAAQRKDATYVANAIATGMAQNLRWPASPDTSANFDYAALMVKFMADLLHSERSSTGGLHLIFLKALDKQEGIDRLIGLYHRYVEEAVRLTEIPEVNRDASAKLHLIHAIGGLKVVLGVFQHLTSNKQLLLPGYLILLTPDKNSSSFFDPNNFLVKLRAKILPAVSMVWESDFLAPSPPIIVRAVFRIILQILEGLGEAGEGAAPTPFPGGIAARAPVIAAPALVSTLIDMGFPRSACESALVRRNNNLQAAADWLMMHPEMVAAARTREAAEEAQNANDAADSSEQTAATTEATAGVTLEVPPSATASGRGTPGDIDMADASGRSTPVPTVGENIMPADSMEVSTSAKGKSTVKRYSREDLSAQRDVTKGTFIKRALFLAKDHGELVFDIRDALKTVDFKPAFGPYDTTKGLDAILKDLIEMLQMAVPTPGEEERSVAARVRLVALIFSDTAFRRAADTCFEKAMTPVEILVGEYKKQNYAAEDRPKWLASVMLLAELIIAKAEMPRDTDIMDMTSTEASQSPVLRGPAFTSQRDALFDLCLDLIRKGIKEQDVFQSSMRLTLLLTRQHEYACRFVEQGGLGVLMKGYAAGRKESENFQQYAVMILRHAVENKVVVRGLMEKHIEGWLGKTRRNPDVSTYCRDLTADAGRDAATFVEVSQQLCRLGPSDTMVKRKEDAKGGDEDKKEGDASTSQSEAEKDGPPKDSEMQIDDLSKSLPSLTMPAAEVESVMHFLLNEAITASSAVIKAVPQTPTSVTPATADASTTTSTAPAPITAVADPLNVRSSSAIPAGDSKEESLPQSLQDYSYSSFILSCIGELVASYTPCKLGLLSYTKRKNDSSSGPAASVSKQGKTRSYFLSHLLAELLPTGALTPGKSTESRKRFALSTQAMGVIINLCNDPVRTASDKDESSPDITLVRKAVLDGIAKAFKDNSTSSEPINARYGRISALSHLCSRLLAPPLPTGSSSSSRSQSELSLHMVKLMLEKNFAVILTNALADVDLNYPQVQNLINAILSPLEHLTKLVTKIGKPNDPPATPAPLSGGAIIDPDDPNIMFVPMPESDEDSGDDRSMRSGTDDEGQEAREEEGQPDEVGDDVYRNSALGMFGGELEPANPEEAYISDEDVDEEMEEWDDQGDDMMDEEGVVPSDVSDDSGDEDEDMEMAGEIRDALEGEGDDDMESSSDDDDDESDESESDDGGDDGAAGQFDQDEEDEAADIQADLAAALQNGQLEPVDDFTGQMINEQMDRMGEPANGGMIRLGGPGWDQPPGNLDGNDEEDVEGGDMMERRSYNEEEEDEEDFDDAGGPQGTFDVNGMFQDLVGGAVAPGQNVQLSIMGGPPGEEHPLLSVDLGAVGGAARARPGTTRGGAAGGLGQHSLLVDNTDAGRNRSRGEFLGPRSRRSGRHGSEYNEWLSSIEDMIGTGAGQLLEQVFGNMQGGGMAMQALPIPGAEGGPPGGASAILQNLINSMNRNGAASRSRHSHHHNHARAENPAAREAHLVNEAIAHPAWVPSSTIDRWNEEAALFSGGMLAPERIQLVSRRLVATLTPEKKRRQKEQDEKDAKEKAERMKEMEELMAKKREEEAKAEAEEAANRPAEAEEATTAMETEPTTASTQEEPGPVQATPATSVPPQTPVAATSAVTGSSERPNWRERVARRRQEQAAAASTQEASQTPSAPSATSNGAQAVPDLSAVFNLANQLAGFDPATGTMQTPAAQPAEVPAEVQPEAEAIASASEDHEMEGVEAESTPAQEGQDEPEAGPSEAATGNNRVMIEIRGQMMDITDTGIDITFLEALPDDMREEVLNQHFRETRAAAAAPAAPAVSSSISAEFLDALPPEMRAEVLAQEALERARIRAQEQAAAALAQQAAGAQAPVQGDEGGEGAPAPAPAGGAPAGEDQMAVDPIAFLASLDPELRATVLMEQGEEMLAALPPDMAAEYEQLREREARHANRRNVARRTGGDGLREYAMGLDRGSSRSAAAALAAASRRNEVPVKREAVQLLDKSGVATLVRLLFFPPPLKKNALQSILVHLCENTKTRVDLINLLLTILHDGTKDSGAGGAVVDKTFSQMSLTKAGKPISKGKGSTQPPSTPSVSTAATPSTPSIPGLPASFVSGGPGENIPNLVVQRSLEALAYLVAANETSAIFFLTEQELQLNLSKDGKRAPGTEKRDKGKGKAVDPALQQSNKICPIVILLSLLDRESLTKSPSIMEALTRLLAHITMPLKNLEANQKKLEEEAKAAAAGNSLAVPATTAAGTTSPSGTTDGIAGSAASSLAPEVPGASSSTTAAPEVPKEPLKKAAEENKLLVKAPQIPNNYLKMVVSILDLGECSSKMFSAALGLINNIWLLPEARKIISTELITLAQKYGKNLIGDLEELETALSATAAGGGENGQQSATLGKFSQASSNQAKILRVLKTIEHAKQQQAKLVKKRKEEREKAKKQKEALEEVKRKLPSFGKDSDKEDKATEDASSAAAQGDKQIEMEMQTEPGTTAPTAAEADEEEEEETRNKVDELYDGFDFSPLWTKLSDCLDVIEKQEDVSNAGTLLPLIEAFLLVSSWGLDGTEAYGQDTPSMLPGGAGPAASPLVRPVMIF